VVVLVPLRESVNATTIALLQLLVVVLVATFFQRWAALTASILAAFAFNYFFLPPLYTLTTAEMNYIYSIDGDTTPQPPTEASRGIQPSAQGFPTQLLRREFTTVVALRNFNP